MSYNKVTFGGSAKGGAVEYASLGAFPAASGSGEFAWATDTETLYYDEPSSSTWKFVAGGGSTVPYTDTFNNTTDWGAASGGSYTITVTAVTHGKSSTPNVQVFENDSGTFIKTETGLTFNGSGDVSITVSETPDNRFAGIIIIN